MNTYKPDAWEDRNLVELYESIGWTPNRMNLINYILEKNPESLLEVACLDGCYIRKLREKGFEGNYVGIDITKSHIEKAVNRTNLKRGPLRDALQQLWRMGSLLLIRIHPLMKMFIFAGNYVGIDITESHIRKAANRTNPSEDFRIGDARNLEFKDNSFDMVTISDVIQHLPSAKVPLSEACRVARDFVFVSIYGTHDKTYTHHTKRSLNTSYNKEHFLKFISDGWHSVQFEVFDLPSKGKTRPLFHFKLERL